ncbi:MAG TPA: hypothetical protein VEY67_09485 [Candidatus Dormibacteraeota bacterium]|nr:hypothetical protein [Candidatus Dormibacteraeota bacterium]
MRRPARASLGPGFTLKASSGTPIESPLAPLVLATIHPSAVLRAPDAEARRVTFERLVSDLRRAWSELHAR